MLMLHKLIKMIVMMALMRMDCSATSHNTHRIYIYMFKNILFTIYIQFINVQYCNELKVANMMHVGVSIQYSQNR